MPVPDTISALNLSGQYTLDTNIGSSTAIADLFSIGGATDPQIHQAVCSETNTIRINHFKDPSGLERIELRHPLGEGLPGISGDYRFDWKEVRYNDPTFGPLVVQARRLSFDEVDPKIRATREIIDSEDAKKNGLIQLRFASAVEGNTRQGWYTDSIFLLNVLLYVLAIRFATIVNTKLGRRLAWVTKTLGPKDEILTEAVHYMDYAGPLKAVKVDG